MSDALTLARDALAEFLDFQSNPKIPTIHDWGRWRRVLDRLNALATPADTHGDWSLLEATQDSLREHMAEIRRLREAAQQALAAQAEPVAWRIVDGEGGYTYAEEGPTDFSKTWVSKYGRSYEPLYAQPVAQPALVPLTDRQLAQIWDEALDQLDTRDQLRFIARAIERAHGITAQPAQKPLTDGQIRTHVQVICRHHGILNGVLEADLSCKFAELIARAVEHAHGITVAIGVKA